VVLRRFTNIITFALMLSMGSLLIFGACGQEEAAAAFDASSSNQGVWSINLNGTSQVVAALHQEGSRLFGSAKSESDDPWNAAVMGDISGKSLELSMISAKDNSITSLRLMGTVHNEYIQGTFIRTDDQGNAESGMFTAVLVNPDPSDYVPAKALPEPSASVDTRTPTAMPSSQPVGDPQYRDVHSLAGTVPESLGVGFAGDGTMGSGGMGMG
jgi:hypothetical protein